MIVGTFVSTRLVGTTVSTRVAGTTISASVDGTSVFARIVPTRLDRRENLLILVPSSRGNAKI